MTVASSVTRHGLDDRAAGRDALVVGRHRHTYGELTRGVQAAAGALAAARLPPGRQPRAALLLQPSIAFFEAFLGAGAAGMAAMVLQRGWSDRELGEALSAGRPAFVVTEPAHRGRVGRHAAAGDIITVGQDGVAHALEAARRPRQHVPKARPARVDDRLPFYIGFTSGTTGRPKGFVRSHRSWLCSFEASAEAFGIAAADSVLAPGPLDHSLFLYAAVHGLSVGATVYLQRRFTPAATLRALADNAITRVYLVPTMLAALLRAADREPSTPRFPHVATVICSGGRWPAAVQERVTDLFPKAEPVDFYGASELSFVSLRRLQCGDPTNSVGRPFPGVEVSLRRDDGKEVGPGESGRLWVRSDMLFSGYLDTSAGGSMRDPAGWMSVGDIARRDAEGRLYLLGREQTMLVRGGVNVFPEEIEDVLMELPEVAEAAVIGIADNYWGDSLCALVRWCDDCTLPRRRLREHCRSRLARDKQPQRWLEVADFPRTRAGKVARATLARALQDGTLDAQEFL